MNINKIVSSLPSGIFADNKVKANKNGTVSRKKGSSLDRSEFRSGLDGLVDKYDFSAELNKKIKETAGDIKKQASIERKDEIIRQVKSNQYVVDVRALAAKLNFADFDLTV